MNLLYIDACIRDDKSRTKQIATPIIEKLKERYIVETINLNEIELFSVKKEENIRRTNGIYSNEIN